eukprot:TRINITY_DN6396_c0_g1_i3.p1 TRINITY_DN6396_c0_g1~~TRINITY_DN6396_c0_g1_i3.p1  ORF type:complete len:137 (-),score=49.34 TRINITY_DN6396_c0_g1_i3:366-776(-)
MQHQSSREGHETDGDESGDGGGDEASYSGEGGEIAAGEELLKKRQRSPSSAYGSSKRRRVNKELVQALQEMEERRLAEQRAQADRYEQFQQAMLHMHIEFHEKMLGMMRQMVEHVAAASGRAQPQGSEREEMDTRR